MPGIVLNITAPKTPNVKMITSLSAPRKTKNDITIAILKIIKISKIGLGRLERNLAFVLIFNKFFE